jgi:tRNA A-37 threonylcarbamoyl transferase component Bud32
MALRCPTCQACLEDGLRYCPHDGTPLTETAAVRTDPTPTGDKPPPAADLPLPLVVGNRYKLVEFRGGGGMARVYRAVDLTLDRAVAVKLINPDLRKEAEFDARFQREARIASQLNDPHIVVVHDFGIDPEHGPFLVMEYLEGQSLREHLQTRGPLPLKAGLQLAGQLILALMHAHNKGIVHRDIKPDNIFLLQQSGVKFHTRVLDFGIARIYRREDANNVETLTNPGAILGTPRYMSPEQLAGQTIDARTDLYSAALVIYEALTKQIAHGSAKRLQELCPEASPQLRDLLDHCLKPDPADRPQSSLEVYLRLQELGRASGILLLPPGEMEKLAAARKAMEPTQAWNPPAKKAPSRRRLLVWGGVLLLVACLGGLAAWGFWFSRSQGGRESLLRVHLGDPKANVIEELHLRKPHTGNPWDKGSPRPPLGKLLRPEDLDLDDQELVSLETRWRHDDQVCVVFHRNQVRGMVVRDRECESARKIRIGDDVSRIYQVYPLNPVRSVLDSEDGQSGVILRYPGLGLAFEIQNEKVTAMALYPPTKR